MMSEEQLVVVLYGNKGTISTIPGCKRRVTPSIHCNDKIPHHNAQKFVTSTTTLLLLIDADADIIHDDDDDA